MPDDTRPTDCTNDRKETEWLWLPGRIQIKRVEPGEPFPVAVR